MKKQSLFNWVCILLSLIPALRLIWLIQYNCSNVVCVDFMHSTLFLNRALSGQFDFKLVFQDSTMHGHPQLVPLTIQLISAKLCHLNALVESYACVVLFYVATYFAFECLAPVNNKLRFAFLPLLSFLEFSLCQSSEFFYCYIFVADTLTRLCIGIGLWSITRIRNNTFAAVLMMVCGILCGASAASYAVAIWAIFGLVLLAMKRLQKPFLICAALGFPISIMPVVLISLGGASRVDPGAIGPDGVARFFATAGMAFLNKTAMQVEVSPLAVSLGVFFIVVLLGLSVFIALRRRYSGEFYCGLAFALFGLLNLLCTSFGRTYICPWYCAFSVFILIGICSISFNILTSRDSESSERLVKVCAGAILAFCATFYVITNRTYADKDWFRAYHSPAAESCLRNYLWAPTYAHYQLLGSKLANIDRYWKYGRDLSLHRLSCFASRQTWSLQGDFILPTVQFVNGNLHKSVCWILDRNLRSKPSFGDPEHFVLAVPAKDSVVWYLNFPSNVKNANLIFDYAAVDIGKSACLNLKVIGSEGKALRAKTLTVDRSWRSFEDDCKEFAGQRVKLTFENSSNEDSVILLRYPRMEADLQFTSSVEQGSEVPTPANLDKEPDKFGIVEEDFGLDNNWQKSWTLTNVKRVGGTTVNSFLSSDNQACLTYKKLLDIDTNRLNEFYFEFAEGVTTTPRFVLCQFVLNNGKLKDGIVTLMSDGKSHRYAYELKLLQLAADERVSFVQVLPHWSFSDASRQFDIGRIGFTRRVYH